MRWRSAWAASTRSPSGLTVRAGGFYDYDGGEGRLCYARNPGC